MTAVDIEPVQASPNWFSRLRRRASERWIYQQELRLNGRPIEALDSTVGPFTVQFESRVLVQLSALKEQYLEGQRFLVPDDWRICEERISEAVRTAQTLAADRPQPTQGSDPVADYLWARQVEVSEFIRTRAQLRVQREYTKGMYIGVVCSVLLLVAIYGATAGVFGIVHSGDKELLALALVAIGGGAAGATLSALIRLRKQEIEDHRASGVRAATIRIVLGWFFAGALMFLVKGDLISIFRIPTGDAAWFFWGALGFIGGFNEAWVTDLVTKKRTT